MRVSVADNAQEPASLQDPNPSSAEAAAADELDDDNDTCVKAVISVIDQCRMSRQDGCLGRLGRGVGAAAHTVPLLH